MIMWGRVASEDCRDRGRIKGEQRMRRLRSERAAYASSVKHAKRRKAERLADYAARGVRVEKWPDDKVHDYICARHEYIQHLRAQRATYAAIGRRLGISRTRVHQLDMLFQRMTKSIKELIPMYADTGDAIRTQRRRDIRMLLTVRALFPDLGAEK